MLRAHVSELHWNVGRHAECDRRFVSTEQLGHILNGRNRDEVIARLDAVLRGTCSVGRFSFAHGEAEI